MLCRLLSWGLFPAQGEPTCSAKISPAKLPYPPGTNSALITHIVERTVLLYMQTDKEVGPMPRLLSKRAATLERSNTHALRPRLMRPENI
jgi:hypothetical protein